MIVLKRLPDAIRDCNQILAVIRGSACNQDGRSSGLTAPNGPSQEAVVAAALKNAGLRPDDIDVIEAHGTGTSLGDPIEAEALNTVFAARPEQSQPLFIGSVKTNIGHLESAAGIAGLIKMVLSLQHGEIPPSLHLGKPNRRIDWERLPLKIPTQLQTWNRRKKTRVGGVSSFGFSGTNAHVIVEEFVPPVPDIPEPVRPFLFMLSAKTSSALSAMAARLDMHLVNHPSLSLADVARTLNTGRSHFEFRAAVTAASQSDLLDRLRNLQRPEDATGIQTGRAIAHSLRVAFLFGEESWEVNAGHELYRRSPAFRTAVDRCGQAVRNVFDQPLGSLMYPDHDQAREHEQTSSAAFQKAAHFAFHCALAGLWRSCGIEPAAVLGVGAGEYPAACVAGLFSMEVGIHLAIGRNHPGSEASQEPSSKISFGEPRIPLILNSGEAKLKSPAKWLEDSESAPLNHAALSALRRETPAANLYIGDNRAFQGFKKSFEKFAENGWPGKPVATFEHRQSESWEFLNAAATLYVLGCSVDLTTFYLEGARTVSLPTYPFERERYWLDTANGPSAKRSLGAPAATAQIQPAPEPSDAWVYDLQWEPKPLVDKSGLTAASLDEPLLAEMALTPATVELMRAEYLTIRWMPLYPTYIVQALQQGGLVPLPEAAFTLEEFSARMRVIPARRRVLERLLAILTEDKILEHTGNQFRFIDFTSRPDADGEVDRLQAEYPEFWTELSILRRCGNKLLAVLQGECDPMQLVFTGGSADEAEQIYERSAVCRFFNEKTARIMRSAVDSIQGRPARILEIGAGTGATTKPVLAALEGIDFEYTFTDISGVFLSRARNKFA
ncbi:MAG: ketoacyl-synthetase C-terminal extension domain-containing protein, partial [Acidobacteriaceae bacterium]